MDKTFNEALKRQLTDAGFTEQETKLGAIAAEFKQGIGLLHAVARAEDARLVIMPAMLLSMTYARLMALACQNAGMDPERITRAADLIGVACRGEASRLTAEQPGEQSHAPDCPHHHHPVPPILDGTPAVNSKDIN